VKLTHIRTLSLGIGRVGIELKQFFRDRESAVFNFLLPMILLVIFGSVFSGQDLGNSGITFSQYFVAGMIASGILYTSFQNLAIAIPMERDDGTLKRLRGTPLPPAAFFIGKIGMVFVAYIAQVTILIAVGVLLFGIDLPTTPLAIFTFIWVSVLGLIAFTLLGIAYSVVPRQGRGAAALVTPVVLVLQFTSGVFFVFGDLPQWMQSFASLFPLKWLTQAMRSVFLPDSAAAMEVSGSWELGMTAIVLVIWIILGALLATFFFRWTPRGENEEPTVRRPANARPNVISSAYSKSPPTGSPLASRETVKPNGTSMRDRYVAVASPSRLGSVAKMTSVTLPSARRGINSLIRRSSGPMPSIGFIDPPRMWYRPRNSRVFSIATTSFGSSTTQITLGSRLGSIQIRHWVL
jgi:ABC-2 type transport system permease protein